MGALQYSATYAEERNRLTVAFRVILAIPHLIVAQVWGYLAQILAVVQWFIVLFTGKRNDGIWKLQDAWLGYEARTLSYVGLLEDPYPPFGTDPGATGVTTSIAFEASANRLTNALRIIWAIPALIIAAVLSVAAYVVVIVSWFAIVFTGRHPRGMWEFIQKVIRYLLRTYSYTLLMTDTYPKVE